MTRVAAILLVLLPAGVLAGAPVILVQDKVPQYREAAKAVHRHLATAVDVDPGDPGAADSLRDATLVVAVGQKALSFAEKHAGETPIVFCMVLGVSRGSLKGRVTGVPLESDPLSTFSAIRAVNPAIHRIGAIYDPQASEVLMTEAQKAAKEAGIALVTRTVTSSMEVRDAMDGLAPNVDALWLPPNPQLISKELFTFLLGFSAERRLPLIGFLDSFTEAGALASISPDYTAIGERAGKLAADISARPDRRAALPALSFATGRLTINLRTAKALGVDVPRAAKEAAKQVY